MEVYQKFWTSSKIWQVKTWYITFLLLISSTGWSSTCTFIFHLIYMSLIWRWHFALFVGILSGRRTNGFITDWFYSELFFSKCSVSKYLLSECSRWLLYILVVIINDVIFLLRWVHNWSWSLCVTSTIARCLIFKIRFRLELNDFTRAGISFILGHVYKLANEASRAIAWRWCRE